MKSIVIIWLIVALLYLTLAGLHWKAMDIKMPYIPMLGVDGISGQEGMDKHIDDLNNSSKRQNFYAAIGYSVASFLALFSMVLGIKENTKLKKR